MNLPNIDDLIRNRHVHTVRMPDGRVESFTTFAGPYFLETDEERQAREKREADAEAERKRKEDEEASSKKFSQSDMDRVATREKKEGQGAAMREVAERFGCSVDDAEKIVKDFRANEEKRKDDVTKATEAAAERERKAEQREADAVARERRASVREQLDDVPTKNRDRAVKLVLGELESSDYTDDEIKAAVKTLRDDMPALFDAHEETDDERKAREKRERNGGRQAPSHDGGRTPPGRKADNNKSAIERGKELAKERSKKGGSSSPLTPIGAKE